MMQAYTEEKRITVPPKEICHLTLKGLRNGAILEQVSLI
jgi:hypothetical protein